jgi:hypothetical protein
MHDFVGVTGVNTVIEGADPDSSAWQALTRYRQRARVALSAGLAALVGGCSWWWKAGFPEDGFVGSAAPLLALAGSLATAVPLGSLMWGRRMGACLERFPAQAVQLRHVFRWGNGTAFALGVDGQNVLLQVGLRYRREMPDASAGSVLFAGDLDGQGLLCSVGGQYLTWVRRPRGARSRRRLARRVAKLDVRDATRDDQLTDPRG